MIRSISSLLARRDADRGPRDPGAQGASPPRDAAPAGCLPDYLRLRRVRAPAAASAATLAGEPAMLPVSVLHRQWRSWAHAQRGSGANCAEAIRRMKDFMNPAIISAGKLDLSGLGLTSLPPNMPPTVIHLCLSHNRFTERPDNLPPRLQHLDLNNNRLSDLSGALPETLKHLSVAHNQLQQVPSDLPPWLRYLNLDDNQLQSLAGTLPSSLKHLSATDNQLRQVPPDLPASITMLRLNRNAIEVLPASLPVRLELLHIHHNMLRRLPDALPAWLTKLDADHNLLERIPDTLPECLQVLYVRHNVISVLPQRWPAALRLLKADDNRIEALPVSFFQAMPKRCNASFRANRLPAHEQARIHEQMARLMVQRVPVQSIALAEPVFLGHFKIRPLILAAAPWHAAGDEQALPPWAGFQEEPGAQAFAGFLDGLSQTRNVELPGFRETIGTWLARLAAEPELRAASFNEAIGATETCVDRVGLTLNAMKKLAIKHDVEHGRYDADLPQLIELARGTFRLDTLEKIAGALAQANPGADEISIFLGLQVRLREALALPTDAAEMTFYHLAEFAPEQLQKASHEVKTAEAEAFPAFLAGWAPWRSVIERLAPASHQAAQAALAEALGDPFEAALTARLTPDKLQDDADSRRIAGPAVMAALAQDIHMAQTRAFLGAEKMSALLASPW